MALRIWLPLNGSLENKGISNIVIINNGVTINDDGKIGKCYSFDGSSYLRANNITCISPDEWGVACWIKPTASSSNGHQYAVSIMSNNNTASSFLFTLCWYANMLSVRTGGNTYSVSGTNILNIWTHLCATYKNQTLKIYVNGELKLTKENPSPPADEHTLIIGRRLTNSGFFYGCLNDIRIYDHCLSPLEVKEISQGLILHYKLNQNLQILNNCYSYPTFNTSSANGGWSHWGKSGHVGTQGQNTDKIYIYNKQNTYSHWVNNDSTATEEYLVYQSPAFEGGYRSLQAIIKEENSKPIDETICFPAWNARNGGTPGGLWTSVIPLGNGFYLCKCEGISQDGSNDLVGIYVKPGYKIYLSEAYLENDKEMCSEILYPRNYIIDSSGYENNGTVIGSLTTEMNNTDGRYLIATKFPLSTAHIQLPVITYSNFGNDYTFSWWEYITTTASSPMPWGFSDGNRLNCYHVNNNMLCWNTGNGTSNPFEPNVTSSSLLNAWHHMVITGDGTTTNLYIDGEYKAKAKTYVGLTGTQVWISGWANANSYTMANNKMSDFRIYTTALSAEDIATLYHTLTQIDNLGGVHGFEINEEQANIFRYELINPYAKNLSAVGTGEWGLRNGEWAMNIKPAPFYKNLEDDKSGFLTNKFLPNTQYVVDYWIDADDVINSDNGSYISSGIFVSYTNGTTDTLYTTGGNGVGFQHKRMITDSDKTIHHIGVKYGANLNTYYRWDSYICPIGQEQIVKEGLIKSTQFIEKNSQASIHESGSMLVTNIIEK